MSDLTEERLDEWMTDAAQRWNACPDHSCAECRRSAIIVRLAGEVFDLRRQLAATAPEGNAPSLTR